MNEIELHLLVFVCIIFLSRITIVHTVAGRCYLCSQNTLVECVGSNQMDSSLYTTILQYYTEPCNGQCVLFRDEKNFITRGCSWTYGHMTSKSTGWHDITPGIKAYFCDSHLCNNGTYEQPEISMMRIGMINSDYILSSQQIITPQQLFVLSENNPSVTHNDQYLPRQLRQCYSCTARFKGCGEFLDPRYVSNYIRPCTSSCILFRNPNDLNLITRDCSTSWPGVRANNGLQKLLGSDAFFCQESLCNGISFDFIMGIFHNSLPTVITFPTIEDISTTITTTLRTTMNIFNDNAIWDDPDLDFVLNESTTPAITNNSTSSSISIDHFDFIDNISPSSTIVGGLAVAQQNLSLNWWDFNDTSIFSSSLTSTSIPTTIHSDEEDWIIFNTTFIPPITRFEHLSADEDSENSNEEINQSAETLFTFDKNSNSETHLDKNDYILSPTLTTTSNIDNNNTQTFIAYSETEEQLLEHIQSLSTLAMPPFSWMLNMAAQNKSVLDNFQNSTTTTTTTEKQNVSLQTTTTSKIPDIFYEYCKNKQCQYGGRLNTDCLCICLPAFTGENCETVLCDEEPQHICSFVLEHECESDSIRYLCPKFCQMNICSSKNM